jgi:hypothetical protein
MVPALITFSTATAIFLVVAVVVQIEQFRSRRLFWGGVRGLLDVKLVQFAKAWTEHWHHFTQYIVKLGWYYSIHSLLRTLLKLLVSMYTYLEHIFERNRKRTKELRQERKQKTEKSHLTQIADHKAETALTSTEKTELRRQKLEQDH